MSAATEMLASLHQRRGYVLQIAGLRYRYATHSGIVSGSNLATYMDTAEAVAYTTLPLLTGLGNYRASIDIAGGVAEYDPVSIELASDGERAIDGDPGVVFGRILPRSLAPVAQLTATATQGDTTLTVESSAGILVDTVLHLGAEAVQVSLVPSPTTLTVTRGEAGTAPRYHVVDDATATAPYLYAEPATWLTRRAVLYACALAPDGRRVSDFVEVYRGFLDETPSVDGERVSLALSPLTALLDVGVGPPQASTGMLSGWHYFTPPLASAYRIGQRIDRFEVVLDGAAVVGPPHQWPLDDQSLYRLYAAYDIELADGTIASLPNHPRVPKFGGAAPVDGWVGGGPPGAGATGVEGDSLTTGIGSGSRQFTGEAFEGRTVPVATADGALRWPVALREAVTAYATDPTAKGLNGLWFGVRLDLDVAAQGFAAYPNEYTSDGWYAGGGVYFFVPEPVGRAFENGYIGRYDDWTTGAAVPMPIRDEALTYPVRITQPDGPGPLRDAGGIAGDYGVIEARISDGPGAGFGQYGEAGAFVPIEAIASAWYQRGESEVLCEQELYIPPGSTLRVRVDYADPDTGDETSATFTATAATAVLDGGDTIGYRLTVADADRGVLPSFGDWPGLPRVKLTPVVEFTGESIGTIIGTILQSNGGESGATYDTAAYGAGLTDAEVDAESIAQIVPPGNLPRLSLELRAGSIVRDVIDPLLRAVGYALTMQTNAAGQCRLTAVPLGFEGSTDAVGSLDADSLGARARWGTDDRIANRFQYLTNWVDGESTRTVIVNDVASQQAYQDVAELEFELRGFDVLEAGAGADAATLLRPIYLRHRALLANPRRTWSVQVGSGPGLFANLGAVYTVTHPQLRGYSDTLGVAGLPGRVVEVDVGLQSEPTSLVLQHYGANARGWNASAVLTGAPVGNVCTVAANTYSPALSVGGRAVQVDADSFAVGDAVLVAAPWDADSAASTTVTAASGNTITLASAPAGAAAGWVIWPADYGTASEEHKRYAYHADATGTVGADAGHEIV